MAIQGMEDKPDTQKASGLRRWVRINLLSRHMHWIPKSDKTLDIGCGWGFAFSMNPEFFGVDADEHCIKHLQSNGYKVKLGNIVKPLPFEDGFFDNAFTHDVLEHLERDEMLTLFRNANRVLRTGGIFMNVVPNRKGYDFGIEINAGHKQFVTKAEIEEAARLTGFEVIDATASPFQGWLGEVFTHNKLVVRCRKVAPAPVLG